MDGSGTASLLGTPRSNPAPRLSSAEIETWNPLHWEKWDQWLCASPGHSFFLSRSWAAVLADSYGYQPRYFGILQNNRFSALLPVMEIRSRLTGTRGVALPFTDYCDPLWEPAVTVPAIADFVLRYGGKSGWQFFEFRPETSSFENEMAFETLAGHRLPLGKDPEQLYARFKDSTRRNIRKAQKSGVEVKRSDSLAALSDYYRLHCLTRKRHGLPPQPFQFFRNIHKHVFNKGSGMVVTAYFKNRPIAAAVFFHFGKQAIYKYGASDAAHQQLRANNLVMWETIRWYAGQGFDVLSFGKTKLQNIGLRRFKTAWGATEFPVCYYRYSYKRNGFVPPRTRDAFAFSTIGTRMPLWLLKAGGALLYKHMG